MIVMCVAVPAAYTIQYAKLCLPPRNVMCLLGNSGLSMLGQRKGGGPRSLTHPASVCVCVILGQPFPWNVLPPAKEKSLQWYAHITLQKHKDDLKRPESEETRPVSLLCVTETDVSACLLFFFHASIFTITPSVMK